MTTLAITLPEERLLRVKEMAARFGITPEELARVSLEELLIPVDS